jgi:hypothetical protein
LSYRNHPLGHDPKQEHCTLELFLLVHTHPQDIQNGIDPSKVFVAVQLLEVFARRKLIETKISSAFSSDNQETKKYLPVMLCSSHNISTVLQSFTDQPSSG